VWAITVATTGVIIADSLTYWVGRLGGHRVFARVGRHWTPGITTLIFGRFVIGARVVVAPIAGARRLPYGRFLCCDALGAMMWATAYVLVGYAAGAKLGELQRQWASVTTVGQIVLAVAVVTFVAVKRLRAWRLRLAVAVGLIAIFSVRAATTAIDELPHTTPSLAETQAQVDLIG